MSGIKHDHTKLRFDLIPPEALMGIASVLTYGAAKYGSRNWEQGLEWGRVYGALQRHLNAYWAGEELDPESGFPHLWHAGCCIAFLITLDARKHTLDVHLDNRPYVGPPHIQMDMLGLVTAQAIDRYQKLKEAAAQPPVQPEGEAA